MVMPLIVFGALVASASGESTKVQKCISNPGGLPINTFIEGCSTTPCGLRQMKNAVINIKFKTSRNTRSMKTLATAYISILGIHVPVPYPLGDNSITCNFINKPCPVSADEELDYTLRMYIEPTFPVGTSLPVEFRIVDQHESAITCVRIPITILPPASG